MLAPHRMKETRGGRSARPQSPMKRRRTLKALSALEILQVAAGEADVLPLIDYLVRDVKLPPAECREAWSIVAEREGLGEMPHVTAVNHRKTETQERFTVIPSPPPPAGEVLERFVKFVRSVSQQNALSSYGDDYCDLRLRLLLPSTSVVFISRQAPYKQAAEFWGDQANGMIRPLLTTPLKELLAEPDTSTDAWLCAAIVVLRELTKGHPAVYVGPSMATALSEPAIAVDRGCLSGTDAGVLVGDTFAPSDNPLCAWLVAARNLPGVQAVASVVLDGPCGGGLDRFVT